jgi:spore maturation protein B
MLVVCAVKKVAVYDCFIEGAKGGLQIVKTILPYISAIFVCITLFKASGLSRAVAQFMSYPLSYLGIPSELSELIFLIPLSGNGTIALLSEIIAEYGPDSYIARCASVVCGASETVFYISAVYFSACKAKKLRYGIPVALFSTLSGVIIACLLCRFM